MPSTMCSGEGSVNIEELSILFQILQFLNSSATSSTAHRNDRFLLQLCLLQQRQHATPSKTKTKPSSKPQPQPFTVLLSLFTLVRKQASHSQTCRPLQLCAFLEPSLPLAPRFCTPPNQPNLPTTLWLLPTRNNSSTTHLSTYTNTPKTRISNNFLHIVITHAFL